MTKIQDTEPDPFIMYLQGEAHPNVVRRKFPGELARFDQDSEELHGILCQLSKNAKISSRIELEPTIDAFLLHIFRNPEKPGVPLWTWLPMKNRAGFVGDIMMSAGADITNLTIHYVFDPDVQEDLHGVTAGSYGTPRKQRARFVENYGLLYFG